MNILDHDDDYDQVTHTHTRTRKRAHADRTLYVKLPDSLRPKNSYIIAKMYVQECLE